ncbi:CCA tRNA nucleotidyltransferase [Desulfurococcaceae archaeon MEX13E-LK6-19]|nr:CCA tRNA nucleotidyltransferase [Desulfurococcaceae archaeon MEX13E-LK6-19]
MSAEELSELEKNILKKIKPSLEEYKKIHSIYDKIKSILEETLREHGVEAEPSLQGSIAKDTWLSGERDLDVFVLFPSNWSREDIEEKGFTILLEAAKKIGSYQVRYAEHPYVRVFIDDVEADIVPAIKITDTKDIRTAVDRTPFHTKYVLENLPPDKRDHVRLLKKFMKNIGVYGAEVKVKGFSGYFTEILVITYGSFRKVLEAASKWRPPVFINTIGKTNGQDIKKIFSRLKRKYPDAVIYAPDPVDPERNVAASVSLKSLAIFSLASRCYLMNPSEEFFFEKQDTVPYSDLIVELDSSERELLFLLFPITKDLPPDVLWGEIDRIRDRLVKLLENYGFEVIYSSTWSNEKNLAIIGVELERIRAPLLKYYEGPPYHITNRAESFIRKHLNKAVAGPWITEDGILAALSPRRYSYVLDILVERIMEYNVAPDFKKTMPIITTIEGLYVLASRDKGVLKWLTKIVLRKSNWMKYCIL